MKTRPSPRPNPNRPLPTILPRLVLAGFLWCGLASCERRNETGSEPVAETSGDTRPESRKSSKPIRSVGGLRFVSYNVENWLTMERYEDRKSVGEKPKPEGEKQHVVRILAEQNPDVLGLCEIGTRDDLQEIQRMLKSSGVDLPHLHHQMGSDPTRALGLLSRHPITSTTTAEDLDYLLERKTYVMGRGILDATVDTGNTEMRFLGVHLKSKREVDYADQGLMRLNEARLLREHVDSILKEDPNAPLVVYGDFNDTYPSATVRAITMHAKKEMRLKPVYLRDSRGEAWTHYWRPHDIYSRIDFTCVSAALNHSVDFGASRIIDDPDWDKASDHRALLVVFR